MGKIADITGNVKTYGKSWIFSWHLVGSGLGKVLTNWRYILILLASVFVILMIIVWSLNLNVLGYILWSGEISLANKASSLIDAASTFFAVSPLVQTVLIIASSAVQSIVITLFIYIVRHRKKVDAAGLSAGGVATIGLFASLGCASCGTSLLMPIVALVASGSAVVIAEALNLIIIAIALVLGLYALKRFGLECYSVVGKHR